MLPESFLDWWFVPWRYARSGAGPSPSTSDELALRDDYRLWCRRNDVAIELPAKLDKAWDVVCTEDAGELIGAARLFCGLFAARQNAQKMLRFLSFADRKWCTSVAALQPINWCHKIEEGGDAGLELHGLRELAVRLEQGFPGMWSRLRLLLPDTLNRQILAPRLISLESGETPAENIARIQRCWHMCRNRALTRIGAANSPLNESLMV